MIVETQYSVGDFVWDLLRKRRTRVLGIRIEKGQMECSATFKSEIQYIVKDALCHTYRRESELMPFEGQKDGEL